MPLNPEAVGSKGEPVEVSWNSKDCLLYAVGVGAGTAELAFTTDFRSVYASVIEGWFGIEHEKVLGARYPVLDLFA